jgi:diguanylate cyclase (GGDEF)-like protein/PAS domain S-box-containing protein
MVSIPANHENQANTTSQIHTANDISQDLIISEFSESNTLINALMSAISVGVYIVQNGRFVYVSPMFESITGYNKEEILGTSSLNYVNPADLDKVKINAVSNLKGQREFSYEYRFIKKDGAEIWIMEKLVSILYQGSHAALGSFIDITEKHHAEAALRESELKYRQLTDNSLVGVYIHQDGKFVFVNNKFAEIHGYQPQELIGISYENLIVPEEYEITRKKVADRISGIVPSPARDEIKRVRKDGTIIWASMLTQAVEFNGRPALMGNVVDVTEQRKLQKAIRESEKKYRFLTENSLVGVYIHQEGKYVFVNNKFAEMHGYRPEELIGADYQLLVCEEDRDITRQNVSKRMEGATGSAATEEMRRQKKDGSQIWVNILTGRIDFNGKPALIGNVIDVTRSKQLTDQLKESREFSQSLLDNSPNPIIVRNLDRKIRYVNRAFEVLTGYTAEEAIHSTVPAPWWIEEDYMSIKDGMDLGYNEGSGTRFQRFRKKNGDEFWVEISFITTPNNIYISNWLDITDQRKAELELRESEEKFRQLFNGASDMIFLMEANARAVPLRILEANEVACRRLGYTREELLDKTRKDISTPEAWAELVKVQAPLLKKSLEMKYETVLLSKDGNKIDTENTVHIYTWKGKNVILSIARDVSERKKWENELLYMATHDPLTGLPNRALLDDRLQVAIANARRRRKGLALIVMDLDKFKNVNDEFGHLVGDKLLKSVSERLSKLLRQSDTVARIGGDEFIILLNEIKSSENVSNVADKILSVFDTPFMIDDLTIHSSTSIGIAIYPKDGRDSISLTRNADSAMYHAKEKGRNMYVFN